MKSSLARRRGIVLVLAALCTPFAFAQEAHRITPEMTMQLRLSQQLQAYGIANADPFTLLNAARLLRASGFRVVEEEAKARSQDTGGMLSPDALLDRAQALAKGQTELLALIQDERVNRGRDTTIGPQVGQMVLRGGQSTPIKLTYMPKVKAVFGITSDRLQDVVFSVVTADKKSPRCQPKAREFDILCEWMPTDAPDQVEVNLTNNGRAANMLTFFHD